ncbi:MAG: hypothetical protein JNK00_09880 [Flavipsychrobacter sp.]|nr:hypothetical protein [Flavipsychrobacter sp.]
MNLDTVLEAQDFTGIPAFSKDKLCFILNSIAELPSWYKDMVSENGYVSISGKTMQKWIGKDYKKYVDLLVNGGVIEYNGSYIVGKKSIGYKYSETYNVGVKKVLVTDLTLIEKLKQYQWLYNNLEEDEAVDNLATPYKTAVGWYRSGLIKIDHELANQYNKVAFEYKCQSKNFWDKEVTTGRVHYKNPHTQYRASQISIDKISSGRLNPHHDSNVYRLHSVITQCKRELRHAITINGKEVVAVDISNSQPTLLTLLIDHKFWDEEGSFNHTHIPYLNIRDMFSTRQHYTTFIMMCKNAEHNSDRQVEIQRFRDLVASGEFYDNFRSLLEQKLSMTGLSKQDVKTMFFTVLFTSNRFISQDEAACKRVFRDWFPYIYELCRMIKVKDHANLPVLLQRVESYILFNKIIPRMVSEKPNLPFVPIHDSIAVPVGNEAYTELVMREELARCLGFAPHLKREEWKADILTEMITAIQNTSVAA